MAPKAPKVVVIGLAEATLDLILSWAEAGKLPHFQRLKTEGAWGPLQSTIPFVTPQMWGNILTGTNPGRHGAFDFWQRNRQGEFIEINGSFLQEPAVWDHLASASLSSGIMNIPFTYPPRSIPGYMISGEDAPGAHRSIASPPELFDEIERRCGRYRLKDIFPGGRKKYDYLHLVDEDVAKQTDVVKHLLQRHPTDFFMTFFSATAITQHYFWSDMESTDELNPYRGIVESAYVALDKMIGTVMETLGPNATVYVISECGAGPFKTGINVNTWLAQAGFLQFHGESSSGASGNTKSKTWVANLRKQAQGLVQKGLPKSWYYHVNKHLGGIKAWMQNYVYESGIDWSQTQAFSRGKEGNIFINLQGRDPHGVVPPERYDEVVASIKQQLLALTDPDDGKPVVSEVYRADELYDGDLLEYAPDIVVRWRDEQYFPNEGTADDHEIFTPRYREYMNWPTTGNHRLEGIFFAHGPQIVAGKVQEPITIKDLLPTWLKTFDLPVPKTVEGKSIDSIFR